MIHKILILFLFFLVDLNVTLANTPKLNEQANKLIEKSEHFYSHQPGDGEFAALNLQVLNCDSYPYYGYSINGVYNLEKDFKSLLQQTKQCLNTKGGNKQLPSFVHSTFTHFYDILNSSDEKTIACTYGQYNSFYAISYSGKDPDNRGPNGVFDDMPAPPSLLLDTNRMSGNFPLNMSPKKIDNFHKFYGSKLNGTEVVPGKRNPMFSRINNSSSLLFHEILHWTGLGHFPGGYPDLVYLSQLCCFDHDNLGPDAQKVACDIMWDERNWNPNTKERVQHLKDQSTFKKIKHLIELYHGTDKNFDFQSLPTS